MSKKYYWSRNNQIIDDETVNLRFEELLLMRDSEFETWVDYMRARVLEVWDAYDLPPLSGKDEQEMIEQFRTMSGTPGARLSMHKAKSGGTKPYKDEMDGKENIIINDGYLGSCCNQFFPNMMKAKINHQTKVVDGGGFNGYAVYDLFSDKERFRNRMVKGCRRHFKRDSFYRQSFSIPVNSSLGLVPAETGKLWVQLFRRDFIRFKDSGFWLSRVEPAEEGETGTGYTEIDAQKFLWLSKQEIRELVLNRIVQWENLTNLITVPDNIRESDNVEYKSLELVKILETELKDSEQYHIRFYFKNTRVFPNGFTAFKIGYIQVAVNFPPMIAKYLYEKYTKDLKDQDVITIYDPSSGWGGRLVGAMTVLDDRHIHYVGTDPNTDNVIDDLGITKYEYLGNFINSSLNNFGYNPHTFHIFRDGSEVIGDNPDFQQYKGNFDMVFTSPPYFSKEQYSEDETQSCIKFPDYKGWLEGFLKPTLKNAYDSLKPNRYLLWNIADVYYAGGIQLTLEQDSIDIMKSLGAEYVGIEKMVMANMPGQNRMKDGKPTCKNHCRVNGKWHKYEPIFVFKKPDSFS